MAVLRDLNRRSLLSPNDDQRKDKRNQPEDDVVCNGQSHVSLLSEQK